jgi:hypothetical protein
VAEARRERLRVRVAQQRAKQQRNTRGQADAKKRKQ